MFYSRVEGGHALPSVLVFKRLVVELQVDAAELLSIDNMSTAGEDADSLILARIVEQLWGASKEDVGLGRGRDDALGPALEVLSLGLLDGFTLRPNSASALGRPFCIFESS